MGTDRLAADVRNIDPLLFQHVDGMGAGLLAAARTESGRGSFDATGRHLSQQALGHRAAANVARANEKDVLHFVEGPLRTPAKA